VTIGYRPKPSDQDLQVVRFDGDRPAKPLPDHEGSPRARIHRPRQRLGPDQALSAEAEPVRVLGVRNFGGDQALLIQVGGIQVGFTLAGYTIDEQLDFDLAQGSNGRSQPREGARGRGSVSFRIVRRVGRLAGRPTLKPLAALQAASAVMLPPAERRSFACPFSAVADGEGVAGPTVGAAVVRRAVRRVPGRSPGGPCWSPGGSAGR
jgi:hypothetical protein